jgi:Na+/H+ antiporter NhaC
MNLLKILYEPYIIIIFLALIITIITYFILQYNKKVDEKSNIKETSKTLLYTFIGSIIVLFLLKYGINYMDKNKFFQKGGVVNVSDRLTIVADDIDIGLLEE